MSNPEMPPNDHERRLDDIVAAYHRLADAGGEPARENWLRRYPEFAGELAEYFADLDRTKAVAEPLRNAVAEEPGTTENFHPGAAGSSLSETTPYGVTASGRGPISTGSVLASRFRVFDVKAGGMGIVYLVEDLEELGRGIELKLAVKSVVPYGEWRKSRRSKGASADQGTYANLLHRFRREAEAWVRLGKHDNIIWAGYVFDIGDKPYLLMEYAYGGDLSQWIADRRVTTSMAIRFAIQFCDGMIYAVRTTGMVHRDIKPSNVLIGRNGILKISDFGLSRAHDLVDAGAKGGINVGTESQLSLAGGGTLPYMPPEQFYSIADTDTRSDIFSFGAMLFELLTGRRLFQGRDAYEHLKLRERPIPRAHDLNSDVPPVLSDIIAGCVAFEREDRYACFEDVRAALWDVYQADSQREPMRHDTVSLTPEAHAHSETYSLISLGQFEKAIARIDRALTEFPESPELWLNKGTALSQMRRHAESRNCYQRAIDLRPDYAHAWANLSMTMVELSEPREGYAAAKRALTLDADSYEAWFGQGRSLEALEASGPAEEAYSRAVDIQPHQWKAQYYLGMARFRLGRHDEAIAALQMAVELNPDVHEAWSVLAACFAETGRFEEALGTIDRALVLRADDAVNWAMRGKMLWEGLNDAKAARLSLEKALELAPGYAIAQSLLNQLPPSTATDGAVNP